MEETKNEKLIQQKEKKLLSKDFIICGVEESYSINKDDAIKSDNVYITNFIEALKVTYNVETVSRTGQSSLKKRLCKVLMSSEEEDKSEKIPSDLSNLKDIPEYKTVSVTKDYTITEKRMIKYWSDSAKKTKENDPPVSKFVSRA